MCKQLLLIAALAVPVLVANLCNGDEVTDEIIDNQAMSVTIKSLGALAFTGKLPPDQLARQKIELHDRFWAFLPDVHLSAERLHTEEARFDRAWTAVVKASQDYDVTEVSFIGCDLLGLIKCVDMYYLTVTPNGPVLFRFSMEFEVRGRARLMGIAVYTDWDKVKDLTRNIQHPTSASRVPTITWHASTTATAPANPSNGTPRR